MKKQNEDYILKDRKPRTGAKITVEGVTTRLAYRKEYNKKYREQNRDYFKYAHVKKRSEILKTKEYNSFKDQIRRLEDHLDDLKRENKNLLKSLLHFVVKNNLS